MRFLWGKKPKKIAQKGGKNALNKNVFLPIKSSNSHFPMI